MKYLLFSSLMLFVFSCQSGPAPLFYINDNNAYESDFLFMAESANVPPIAPDSAALLLYPKEVVESGYWNSKTESLGDTVLSGPVVYKDYGEIYRSEEFTMRVLFRDGNDSLGRDYTFKLRTYSRSGHIIDSYDLAVWNEREREFCFGSINEDLMIEKRCKDVENSERMQVLFDGRFVSSEFEE